MKFKRNLRPRDEEWCSMPAVFWLATVLAAVLLVITAGVTLYAVWLSL